MSKGIETDDSIKEKLEYLGLNLNNIPKQYKEYTSLDFRPSRSSEGKTYKVYKYLDVNEIQILLTPTNRLCSIIEKYEKAAPLYAYIMPENEQDIERYTTFLKMLETMEIEKIEEVVREQKQLEDKIPFEIKFPKNYLWQIYYSEYTKKYFMLVPTEDLEYTAFFYLIREQLKKKRNKIFVPISYIDYSREYLNRSQIEEVEKYLCFFTKEWPITYEVYDKNNELSIQITGTTYIYDDIKSKYKIKLNSKEEAEKFYKLIKALFILQTEVPHYYKFNIKINDKGSLEFYGDNKKIIYEILSSVIKEEYIKAEDILKEVSKEKEKLEKEVKKLKKESNKLDEKFLEKEKQISTFLECKRTFFGRVKYFLKYKKSSKTKENTEKITEKDVEKEDNEIKIEKFEEIKKYYTLEELVKIYKIIERLNMNTKDLKLDVTSLTTKVKNIKSKIQNATLYIEEIDKHKKSIFEFWRFTNKDKISELPAGEIINEKSRKLKKVFRYDLDFEDLSKQLDKKQRENLTEEELNSVFIATTQILEDINLVLAKKEITEERVDQIKEFAAKEKMLFDKENFDIFGGIEANNNNKIKILANRKHREIAKELFSILDINQKTNVKEYTETISKITENINLAINKINTDIQMPIYKVSKEDLTGINIFNINPENAIQEFKEDLEVKEINLYKINLNEDTKMLALTNIIYYYNNNQTLPLGMNISDEILLNIDNQNLNKINTEEFNITTYENPEDELSKLIIKKIKVIEFKVEI